MASNTLGFLNMPPAMANYVLAQQQQAALDQVGKDTAQVLASSPGIIRHNPSLPLLAAGVAKFGAGIGQGIAQQIAPDTNAAELKNLAKKTQDIAGTVDYNKPETILKAAQQAMQLGNPTAAQRYISMYQSVKASGKNF